MGRTKEPKIKVKRMTKSELDKMHEKFADLDTAVRTCIRPKVQLCATQTPPPSPNVYTGHPQAIASTRRESFRTRDLLHDADATLSHAVVTPLLHASQVIQHWTVEEVCDNFLSPLGELCDPPESLVPWLGRAHRVAVRMALSRPATATNGRKFNMAQGHDPR
jgi:hypothetical protein